MIPMLIAKKIGGAIKTYGDSMQKSTQKGKGGDGGDSSSGNSKVTSGARKVGTKAGSFLKKKLGIGKSSPVKGTFKGMTKQE